MLWKSERRIATDLRLEPKNKRLALLQAFELLVAKTSILHEARVRLRSLSELVRLRPKVDIRGYYKNNLPKRAIADSLRADAEPSWTQLNPSLVLSRFA